MAFILPKWGGAMVHSDPQMTDYINLPIPKNNVEKIWYKNELKGEKAGTMGNGIAGNGKIAANTFNGLKDNLIIYDYDGNHLWTSNHKLNPIATASTPMVDMKNRVIACDNKTILMVGPGNNGYKIIWENDIDYRGEGLFNTGILLPFSPTIVDGKIIILPTNSGPVYAFDAHNGEKLAEMYLGLGEIIRGKGYFSTQNSACVNGNRVYITTEYTLSTKYHRKISLGRLYALDVNHKSKNEDEVLTVAWFYPFIGKSQASPVLIDDTVYFDVYKPGLLGLLEKPYIHAITDKGDHYEEKWRIGYPKNSNMPREIRGKTWFSFSKDPRGGFWFEDQLGSRLVHFKEEDGNIIEEILIKDLIPGNTFGLYWPLSCMTICDQKEPVMLISAISIFHNKYLVAVDLDNDNSVLWKIQIKSRHGLNYAGGQFTILKKNNDPSKNRILFGTYYDGVMAIGTKD